jgi:hypothetical protein
MTEQLEKQSWHIANSTSTDESVISFLILLMNQKDNSA